MRRLLLLACFVALITGCNKFDGQLIGVQGRPSWFQADPYGMVYIGMGNYMMGPDDQEVPYAYTTKQKMVSVQAFYMDDSEISNNEYRQFVYWVRDSLFKMALGQDADPSQIITTDAKGNDLETPAINWDQKIKWDDPNVMEALTEAGMFLPAQERCYQRVEVDTRQLNYLFYSLNVRLAAVKNGVENGNRFIADRTAPDKKNQTFITGKGSYTVTDKTYQGGGVYQTRKRDKMDRSVFIDKQVVNVYPDTLAWVHDFTYSFNEPMTNMYFWHPAYDNYPVVGVSWKQATAFCVWRTQLMDSYLERTEQSIVNDFRLPTEAEWEYAARGGLSLSPYPWGGPYIRNSRGCFLCNFKPMRGSYMDDGGFHTVGIYSYNPNDYGLYCMAGNAAEWTADAYDESAYDFSHDLNSSYVYTADDKEPSVLKRKVIRGGSWKDVGYYCQTSTRTYEYQDTAKCYVGFRCVETYLGRAKGDALDNVSSAHE